MWQGRGINTEYRPINEIHARINVHSEHSTTVWNVHGLPRQHSDVWLWLFPNRLIILVYVTFDYLSVISFAFLLFLLLLSR
jgi:hypothetical protein